MQQPIQAILYWPSAGNHHGETYNLQAGGSETIRNQHQGNKLQKPEMEGTFRLIKDWEFSLVLSLTSKGISFNPLSFSRKCPHVTVT